MKDKKVLVENLDWFDRYLPYTICFGVSGNWVKAFTKLDRPAPVPFWYYIYLMHGGTGSGAPLGAEAFSLADIEKGFTAMRLGIVLYVIPFFFIFNPALILEGSLIETLYLFILCVIGILILAGGVEGYLLKVERLNMWARPLLVIGGFLIAVPQLTTSIIGAGLTALVLVIILIQRRLKAEKPVISE